MASNYPIARAAEVPYKNGALFTPYPATLLRETYSDLFRDLDAGEKLQIFTHFFRTINHGDPALTLENPLAQNFRVVMRDAVNLVHNQPTGQRLWTITPRRMLRIILKEHRQLAENYVLPHLTVTQRAMGNALLAWVTDNEVPRTPCGTAELRDRIQVLEAQLEAAQDALHDAAALAENVARAEQAANAATARALQAEAALQELRDGMRRLLQ